MIWILIMQLHVQYLMYKTVNPC